MRRKARELGVSIEEMQALAKDEDMDHAIDRAIANLPTGSSPLLIDARMGWAFSPRCLSVLVTCSSEVAGARVFAAARADEGYPSPDAAAAALTQRRDQEVARYGSLYGLSYADESVFDIVVDMEATTPNLASERVVRAALELEDETRKGVIDRFRGEYFFLSNMFETPVRFEGLNYPCSESAYQAQKLVDPAMRERVSRMDGKEAKRFASVLPVRDDWPKMRRDVMERVIRVKFSQSPELRERLLGTEGLWLEEGNDWGDSYFGVITLEVTGHSFGANVLGRTLMKVRREISGRPALGD